MFPPANVAEWLLEAQTALQALMAGSAEEEIHLADGSSVRYGLSNIVDLQKYIASLSAQITPRRPIFFGFGR